MIKVILCAAVLASGLIACSNPCDDLRDQCNACEVDLAKAACDLVVSADDGDACELVLDANTYASGSAACTN